MTLGLLLLFALFAGAIVYSLGTVDRTLPPGGAA